MKRQVVLVAAILAWHGGLGAVDGPDVIRRLQARFEELRSLSARFEKRHYWKLGEQNLEIRGQLRVEKPDRFRLETDVQTVVTDGETAWNYTPADSQVILSRYESVRDDRSYEKLLFDLILLGGYSDRFAPRDAGLERVDREWCHVVDLAARDEDAYICRIRLWVDRREWLVRQVEYGNINDDVTTYRLWDLKVNKKLPASTFVFEAPGGVEVLDLR